jgi:hypothetical protein
MLCYEMEAPTKTNVSPRCVGSSWSKGIGAFVNYRFYVAFAWWLDAIVVLKVGLCLKHCYGNAKH